MLIWSTPLVVGVIAAGFFDALTGQALGWNVQTAIAAMWAYALARVSFVLAAMRLHAAVLFRTSSAMRRAMLRWIYKLPGAGAVDETPGEVVSRFRDDVEHTTEAFDLTVDLVSALVSAAISVTVLVSIDARITAYVFAPVALIIVITSRLGVTIRRYRTAARQATEDITGFLGEMLGSVQSVKVADAEAPMLAHFDELNDRRRQHMVRDRTFTAGIEAVFYNTVSVGTGLILILAVGSLGAETGAGLTIGEFSLFVFVLQLVTESAWFIGVFLARVRQAEVSVGRAVALMRGADWEDLTEEIALEEELKAPAVPARGSQSHPKILEVEGLSYSYPGSEAGINGIGFAVEPGQFVVVTGKIGSGKTTLLRTILGLLPADSGRIEWRGEPIEDPGSFLVPPRAAYTPQVPRLFSMSLRDNLLLGHVVDDADLDRAVATATMQRDIDDMPNGFETLVGPRGVRLSGGQLQRSAAARMLVRSPELLVFDDLSSALDVETESMLWSRLFENYGDSTALVVSHRRPALQRADVVLLMDRGSVVDIGKADDLLARSRLFNELWGGLPGAH